MTPDLPPAVAGFFRVHNTGQTDGFTDLFTPDARVTDESHEYRGAAIGTWIEGAIAKYHPKAEVMNVDQADDQIIVTALVSGSFPGSPVQLCYQFTLSDQKIVTLAIVA